MLIPKRAAEAFGSPHYKHKKTQKKRKRPSSRRSLSDRTGRPLTVRVRYQVATCAVEALDSRGSAITSGRSAGDTFAMRAVDALLWDLKD